MKKVNIILYDDRYYWNLLDLLQKFQKQVYHGKTKINFDRFLEVHKGFIYLALNEENEAVGFSTFVYNDWYGMREPTIGNDFIYIEKEYRMSKAFHLFSIQAGIICVENNISLEHYFASEESAKSIGRMEGEKLFTTYVYPINEIKRELERITSKVRIKYAY